MGEWVDRTHILPIMNCIWRQDNLHIGAHVNYYTVQLTRTWHFGMIIHVLPECTGVERERVLSLSDTRQETSLSVGLLEKIVTGQKEYFQQRNLPVYLLLRRSRHSNSTWNWLHVFSYERLFFLLLRRHIIHPTVSFTSVICLHT